MNVKTDNSIRTINFNNIKIGGESSFPILNPVYVLNIKFFDPSENFEIAKNYYKTDDRIKIVEKAVNSDCDILGLSFNIKSVEEISIAVDYLKKVLPEITKPLMISGSGQDDIDKILIPQLLSVLDREVIVSSADENTYKNIVPEVIKGGHVLVLKSPIDINLAKELNILSADLGLDLNKILIDTDIGGLGYGLEYGYSIMEKIKLEGLKGDEYLNMPILSMACEESLKTKEAKSDGFTDSWGALEDRAKYFELSAASAVMACGADVIVMNYPPNISVMKGLV
ncbi:hypothetical protein IKP85_02715 [bacterium]|nr:hypothetical protein [bacterium]